MCKSVLLAMSGGVDSSAAALLLKNKYETVAGATFLLCEGNECDLADAATVAAKLCISHHTFDFRDDFSHHVMDYFTSTYIACKTPNPCIECNKHIKFKKLIECADTLGYELIATGHYARIEKNGDKFLLRKALDESKDQSYVLYMLTQDILSRTVFPLGELKKTEIRALAEKNGFVNAHKKDSQDICFIKNGEYREFIEKRTGEKFPTGDFLLTDGTKIGTHKGLIGYTIGQRKGLGLSYSEPLYVVGKDAEKCAVTVGIESELYTNTVNVSGVSFISESVPDGAEIFARLRYNQKEKKARIFQSGENSVILEFDEPQRAVTSGQSAVFYDGDYVLGGGIIE